MRLTLRRKGQVKSFESILTIESMVSNRQDIVELVKFIKTNGGLANETLLQSKMGEGVPKIYISGILNHLKSIGLLNPNGELSTRGSRIASTGLVPVEGRGQFAIYFIEDEILNHLVLYHERSKNFNKSGGTKLDSDPFVGNSYRSVIDSAEFKIKHFESKNQSAYLNQDSGIYELVWEIDVDQTVHSKIYLSGELKSVSRNILRYRSHELEGMNDRTTSKLVYKLIEDHKQEGMRWNDVTECLEVPLDGLSKEQYENLSLSLNIPSLSIKGLGEFEATKIHSIAIGPKHDQDAKKWILLLVEKFLENGYKSSHEILGYLDELRQHRAFINYQYILDTIKIDELAREVKERKNYNSYWNIQAPLDLFMDVDERFIVRNRRVDITPGKELSMMELVQEIVHVEKPETLVFSSKFVKNPAQIKKFILFVESFRSKGVKDVLLVTKEPVELNDNTIQLKLYDDVYSGVIQPHDRYFAYQSEGGWHRFKMTAELDQCRYRSLLNVDIHTKGVWQDISFMEVTPEIFPVKLNDKLSEIEGVHHL
ncbi:hypothetical protein LF817_16430 [Halobacillus sp. A1]|uniref:hypothetical protein n=1 Tax=Halobacillus sp. A1 TaxID=2880262 RepID=UPI0020A6D2FF|nr:hypothetical protein [Halobacillus sp. A1]MCP3032913.1 hypothetical protein [Halobacillus sp. A1]